MGKEEIMLEMKKTMTKKTYKALMASRRGVNGFNTGTRTHKDGKDKMYDRRLWKKEIAVYA